MAQFLRFLLAAFTCKCFHRGELRALIDETSKAFWSFFRLLITSLFFSIFGVFDKIWAEPGDQGSRQTAVDQLYFVSPTGDQKQVWYRLVYHSNVTAKENISPNENQSVLPDPAFVNPLVIVPGMGESSYLYVGNRATREILTQYFNPILVIDHRNQGASAHGHLRPRVTAKSYEDYVRDIKYLVETVAPIEFSRTTGQKPDNFSQLSVLSHSMGSLITYLASFETEAIRRHLMLAPLFKISNKLLPETQQKRADILAKALVRLGLGGVVRVNPNRSGRPSKNLLEDILTGEKVLGEAVKAVDPFWYFSIQRAIEKAQSLPVDSLPHVAIAAVLAKKDRFVDNKVTLDRLACDRSGALNCNVTMVDGGHANHFSSPENFERAILIASHFFAHGSLPTSDDLPPPACLSLTQSGLK